MKKTRYFSTRANFSIGDDDYEVSARVSRDEVEAANDVTRSDEDGNDTVIAYADFVALYAAGRGLAVRDAEREVEDSLYEAAGDAISEAYDDFPEYDKYEAEERRLAAYEGD